MRFVRLSLKKLILALMVAWLAVGLGFSPALNLSSEAKKKAGGGDAEVKKVVDPINEQLGKLMFKVQSRALLSPEEAGQLSDIKFKLVDALTQYPGNAMLVRPLYEAAILFSQRESYNDAYELYSYLVQGFATTPYGMKSKGQIAQLEKRFGADYFAADGAGSPDPAAAGAVPPVKK
jgi:hypothetical protein